MKFKFLHPKFISTWILFVLMYLASLLPFKIQISLGKFIGRFLQKLMINRNHIAQINLEKCFPDKTKNEIKQLKEKHFESIGISLFEIADCFFMSNNRLKKLHKIIGADNLQQALDENKNIILLIGHFTTMMIAGRFLSQHFKFADIYRPQNNAVFDFMMVRRLQGFGLKMVSAKNTKDMLITLKSGLPLWYAHDQDLGSRSSSIFADFFKIPTSTINATAKFAKIRNTVVIPLAFWRNQKNNYVLKLDKPLENYPNEDNLQNATLTNRILEEQIKNAPSQYGWIHKRFKTRPKNISSFYK